MNQFKIGVMQGRLLPKYKGRYQAHPVGYWKDEFPIASSLNLDSIEFILDYEDFEKNPLIYSGGAEEINKITAQTNVLVKSICADYFMEASLFSSDKIKLEQSIKVLKQLIHISPVIGVNNIVIPCVDSSSLNTKEEEEIFIDSISMCLSDALKNSVNLCLETNLNPRRFLSLLKRIDSPLVKVNYDIGNSASLGYNYIEEFTVYGDFISDVHIKDRVENGGSVLLGTGAAELSEVLNTLKDNNYKGIFIMQAYRDEDGLGIFKKQLDYVLNLLSNL